jgi:hypothetical protein
MVTNFVTRRQNLSPTARIYHTHNVTLSFVTLWQTSVKHTFFACVNPKCVGRHYIPSVAGDKYRHSPTSLVTDRGNLAMGGLTFWHNDILSTQ